MQLCNYSTLYWMPRGSKIHLHFSVRRGRSGCERKRHTERQTTKQEGERPGIQRLLPWQLHAVRKEDADKWAWVHGGMAKLWCQSSLQNVPTGECILFTFLLAQLKLLMSLTMTMYFSFMLWNFDLSFLFCYFFFFLGKAVTHHAAFFSSVFR